MADEGAGGGFAATIDSAFAPVSDAVSAIIFYSIEIGGMDLPIVVIWLISAAAATVCLTKRRARPYPKPAASWLPRFRPAL